MKKRFLSRLVALVSVVSLSFNLIFPPVSNAFAVSSSAVVTAVTGTAVKAGTTILSSGGGQIVGYCAGGVAVGAETFHATMSFLANVLIACGMVGSVNNDIENLNVVRDFKKKNDLGMASMFEVYQLRKLEFAGQEYDVFDFGPAAQEYLLSYFYEKPANIDGKTINVYPNAIYEDMTIDTGYAVSDVGGLSPLLPYNPETGVVSLCNINVDEIMSVKGLTSGYGTTYPFTWHYEEEDRFYIPRVTSNTRTDLTTGYYNSELWRSYEPFARFVDLNPITQIFKLPSDLTAENDSAIDTWQELTEDTGGIEFKIFDDEDCPTWYLYCSAVGSSSSGSLDMAIKTTCTDCDLNYDFNNSTYQPERTIGDLQYYPIDLYLGFGPTFTKSNSNYVLDSMKFRFYAPDTYSTTSNLATMYSSSDDSVKFSNLCNNCNTYFRNKFLVYDAENTRMVPKLGTYGYTRDYQSKTGEWNIPDFKEEGSDWAIFVPSGSTYADVLNGNASMEWVNLNAITYTDLGVPDSTQFGEVEYIENTGTIGGSEVVPPSDTPGGDSESDSALIEQLEEWILGGITFTPDMFNNLSVGATGAFSSMSDAISYGTFTGIQMSQYSDILSALQQGLNPSASGSVSPNVPNNPNLFDLILILWDVLLACIRLVCRALVFIATLSAIPVSTSLLNSHIILGIDYFRSLSFGVMNLYDLVIWFCGIMFGIKVVKFIRNHYHV